MSELTEKYFIDWESDVFGYGYGSGEPHTLKALQDFFKETPDNKYDFEVLEEKLTPTVTWLLINTLCHANILEYGTSPRYGWLTEGGKFLKDFVLKRTVDELLGLTGKNDYDDGYIHCLRSYCNCPKGYKCSNPLF